MNMKDVKKLVRKELVPTLRERGWSGNADKLVRHADGADLYMSVVGMPSAFGPLRSLVVDIGVAPALGSLPREPALRLLCNGWDEFLLHHLPSPLQRRFPKNGTKGSDHYIYGDKEPDVIVRDVDQLVQKGEKWSRGITVATVRKWLDKELAGGIRPAAKWQHFSYRAMEVVVLLAEGDAERARVRRAELTALLRDPAHAVFEERLLPRLDALGVG